jgi:hypothetical protein
VEGAQHCSAKSARAAIGDAGPDELARGQADEEHFLIGAGTCKSGGSDAWQDAAEEGPRPPEPDAAQLELRPFHPSLVSSLPCPSPVTGAHQPRKGAHHSAAATSHALGAQLAAPHGTSCAAPAPPTHTANATNAAHAANAANAANAAAAARSLCTRVTVY